MLSWSMMPSFALFQLLLLGSKKQRDNAGTMMNHAGASQITPLR
jgi:hypothetical protein